MDSELLLAARPFPLNNLIAPPHGQLWISPKRSGEAGSFESLQDKGTIYPSKNDHCCPATGCLIGIGEREEKVPESELNRRLKNLLVIPQEELTELCPEAVPDQPLGEAESNPEDQEVLQLTVAEVPPITDEFQEEEYDSDEQD